MIVKTLKTQTREEKIKGTACVKTPDGREGAMLQRSLNKSVKLLSLFCFLGSELELKKEEKNFFCKVSYLTQREGSKERKGKGQLRAASQGPG